MISGGNLSNFMAKSSTIYEATLTPLKSSSTTINIAANNFTDDAGNSNNTASNSFIWTYDGTPTTITVSAKASGQTINSGSTSNDSTLILTFLTSEETTDLNIEDISITGGELNNFVSSNFASINGTLYNATLIPSKSGTVTIKINSNSFTHQVGNGNIEAKPFNWNYDGTAPIIFLLVTSGNDTISSGMTTTM